MKKDFLQQLNQEYGLNLTSQDLSAIANAVGDPNSAYAREEEVRKIFAQLEEDKKIGKQFGIGEDVLQSLHPNEHGKQLEEQLEDFLEDDD